MQPLIGFVKSGPSHYTAYIINHVTTRVRPRDYERSSGDSEEERCVLDRVEEARPRANMESSPVSDTARITPAYNEVNN